MPALSHAESSVQAEPDSMQVDEPLGRILALDYGRRYVGLAVSDALRLIARPLQTIERTNRAKLIRSLRLIAQEQQARQIIVSYPLNLDGSVSEMATEAAAFATRLQKELGVPVEMVDERLTSWAAKTMPRQPSAAKGLGRRHRRTKDDAVAAAILLQDYLAALSSNCQPSVPNEGK